MADERVTFTVFTGEAGGTWFEAGRARASEPDPLCCGACGVPMREDHRAEQWRCSSCDAHADHETLARLELRYSIDVTSEPAPVVWTRDRGLHVKGGCRRWPWVDPAEQLRRAAATAQRAREAITRALIAHLVEGLDDGADEHLIAHDCPEDPDVHRRYWLHAGAEAAVIGDVLTDGSWRWSPWRRHPDCCLRGTLSAGARHAWSCPAARVVRDEARATADVLDPAALMRGIGVL